jgi:hypothetical protein
MKRGHLNEEEIRYSSELLYACREGRCGEGTDPLGWVVEDVGLMGGWNEGRGAFPLNDQLWIATSEEHQTQPAGSCK